MEKAGSFRVKHSWFLVQFLRTKLPWRPLYTDCFHDLFISGIPQVVLLTKVDKVDVTLATDVSTVFKNTKVKEVVLETSRLFGIPSNQVLPVMNYEKELALDTGVDTLALLALRQMLYLAEDHLDNAQMREAASAIRIGGADNVQGRRAREVETASESI